MFFREFYNVDKGRGLLFIFLVLLLHIVYGGKLLEIVKLTQHGTINNDKFLAQRYVM